MQLGGWLWILIAAGLVACGAAMIYATAQWRSARKNQALHQRSEQAARENYRRGG
jgi:hypothetical protein